jgi:Caspase domain
MTDAKNGLAIVLGASAWPKYPSFETSPAFQNSANFVRNYILREDGVGLIADNLLWLFDDEGLPGNIVQKMGDFLRQRATSDIRNIFLYYVGHGGYLDREYFLALRCTDQDNRDLTVLPVKYIAKKLYEETPDKRHIVIIDACYASGAVKDFIYQDAGTALADVREQIRDVLSELDIDKGSALFCSAGPKTKAKAPWEGEYTMFSGALQRVLTTGDPTSNDYLSLEEVADLVEKDIRNTFRAEAVRPELHTPKQEKGDIRGLRLFPNPARRKIAEGEAIRELRAALDKVVHTVDSLGRELHAVRHDMVAKAASQEEIGPAYSRRPSPLKLIVSSLFFVLVSLAGAISVYIKWTISHQINLMPISAVYFTGIFLLGYGYLAMLLLPNLKLTGVLHRVRSEIFGEILSPKAVFWAMIVGFALHWYVVTLFESYIEPVSTSPLEGPPAVQR